MADSHDELLLAFGRRLAGRRRALGLTQAQVAERMGLAAAESVSRYERGGQDPKLSTLMRFARALECQASELLPLQSARTANPDHDALREEGQVLLARLARADSAACRLAVGGLRGMLDMLASPRSSSD